MAAITPNHLLREQLEERVRTVDKDVFDELAMDIFAYQSTQNPVYAEFCQLLGRSTGNVHFPEEIPFLPISLFKTHVLTTNAGSAEIVFESSATTGQVPGRHLVRDLAAYHRNARRGFHAVVGRPVSDFRWIALLPSYVERPNSSLVSMVSDFIAYGRSGSTFAGLDQIADITNSSDDPTILITVSFALYDLVNAGIRHSDQLIVLETGGMKGRRTEATRAELHALMQTSLKLPVVWSEYGMTELLSQAWSTGEGIFRSSPTLRLYTREVADPTALQRAGSRGPLNCIDLANLDSCSFIATDDVGVVFPDGSFEVHGRLDASELRGCNLMYPMMH